MDAKSKGIGVGGLLIIVIIIGFIGALIWISMQEQYADEAKQTESNSSHQAEKTP